VPAERESDSNELVFWLNGQKVVIPDPDPTILLTDYLHSVGYRNQGGCAREAAAPGTVMLSHATRSAAPPWHRAAPCVADPV